MKKYFFTGFIALLPITLTVMIVHYLFNLFTTPFVGIVESLLDSYEKSSGAQLTHHEFLVNFISRIIILLFLFLLALALGKWGRKFFVNLVNKVFLNIPFVKTIYHMIQEVTKATFSQEEKTFKETVLVSFPSPATKAIGFITGPVPPGLKKYIEQADYNVFVPTSPQPISGFLLLTPKKEVTHVDVTTEEAIKFLISCGALHPGEKKDV